MASGDQLLPSSGVSAMLPQQLSIPSFIDKPEDNDDNDISEEKSAGLISQLAFLEESEDKKMETDKTDEDKSISDYSDTEGSVGSDEDVDEEDGEDDDDDDDEDDDEDDDDDDDYEDEENDGEEGDEDANSEDNGDLGGDAEVELQVNDIISKLDMDDKLGMDDDNIIETKDFADLTDDSKPSTSLFSFTPLTEEKPAEASESKPAESAAKKPKRSRKRKRKLTKEERAERKAKRKKAAPKPSFKRRNIRQIKTEKDLDATTLAAQNEELERQRRLLEQKKALLNKAPFFVSASGIKQETKDCQLKSLLQAVEEDAEKAAKEEMEKLEREAKLKKELEEKKLEEKKKPLEIIDISSTDEEEEEEEEKDNDSDVVMVQSDEEEEEEEDEDDDPNDGGAHIDDNLNQKDEQGRVIVNVGHPPDDPDIFLSPKVAANIKPHQIGGVRFLYDNLVESISRYKSSVGFGCILAHSMGLGKTIQMIGFVDIFLRYTPAKAVLCIVPINTLQNWNSEFNMWLPPEGPSEDPQARHFKVFLLNDNLKTTKARAKVIDSWTKEGGVLLMGYEMYRLLASKRAFPAKPKKTKKPAEPEVIDVDEEDNNKVLMSDMHGALVNPGPDLVICDEGHRIKNNAAGISQQLKNIKTKRRVVLTGYPLQNNLLEYWCMVDFVRPNFLGTKTEFCNMFERPITNGQCQDSTKEDVRVMRYRAYVLHSLLEGFVQRRGHTVLRAALPRKQEFVFLLRMSPIQKKLYTQFMKAINEANMASSEGNNPLKAFAVCCKIWNHPDVLYKLLTGLKKGVDNDLDIETEGGTSTKKKAGSKAGGSSKSSGKKTAAAKAAAASSSSTSASASSATPGGMMGNQGDVYNFPGTGGDGPSMLPTMMGSRMSWAATGTTHSSSSSPGMAGPMSAMGPMQGNMMGMGTMQGNMMGMTPMQGGGMGPVSGNMGQMNLQSNSGMGQMQGSMGSSNMGPSMSSNNSMGQMQGSMGSMGPGMSSNSMGQMQGGMANNGMGQSMPSMNMGQMQGNMGGNMPSNMGGNMPNNMGPMQGGMGQMQGNLGSNMAQMQGSMGNSLMQGNMSNSSSGPNMPGNSMGQMKGGMGSNSNIGPMLGNMAGSSMGQMQGNMSSVMGSMQGNMSNSFMGQMHGNLGNSPSQNMPGNNMGQMMPGNNMGQNMPGNAMGGQNMSNSSMGGMSGMGPMQGSVGQMAGNLGDPMNNCGGSMCDPMTGMPFGSMFGGMGGFPAGGFLGDLNSDSMGDPMCVSMADQMTSNSASHSGQMTNAMSGSPGSGMTSNMGGNAGCPSGGMTHSMSSGAMGQDPGMSGSMDGSSLGEMSGNSFRSSPGQMSSNSFGPPACPSANPFGDMTGFDTGQQCSNNMPNLGESRLGADSADAQEYTTVTTSGSTIGTGTLTDSIVSTSDTVTCSATDTAVGMQGPRDSSGLTPTGSATGEMSRTAETSTTSTTGTCVSATTTGSELDDGKTTGTKMAESSTGTDASPGSASTSTTATASSSTSTTTGSSGNIPGPVGDALASQDKKSENSISYEWAEDLMKDYIPSIVENSGKMVLLLQLVDETVKMGDKILVFSQSLTTLNVIEDFLSKFNVPRPDLNERWCKNKNYFRLDGSTSGTERERLINQFNDPYNNRFWLFLLSTRAGCLGINLVGANRVVVMDASWNPCHDCQAICRVYRFGQEKPSYIYRLVTDNSLEKKIYDRQVNKQGMSDRVIDELNPDNQFLRRKLDNLLEYEEKDDPPDLEFDNHLGEFDDPVLYRVLQVKGSWLTKNPFTHESLLIDRKELRLTKKDKRLAKENYARDKKMNTTYSRPSYAAFYPRNNMGQPQPAGVSFRTITVNRPVASVKPMICSPATSRKTLPVFNSNLRPGVSVHQVITTTEITLPGSNATTEAGSVSKIPAGQRVLVIKTPKGIYIRTVDGKLFAVRSKEGSQPLSLPGSSGAPASVAATLSTSQSPGTIRIVTCPPGGFKKDGKDFPRIIIKDASGTGGGSVISTDLLSSIYSQTKTVNAIIQGQDPKTGAKTLIIPCSKPATDAKDSKTAEAGTSMEIKKEGGETKIFTSMPQMLKLVSTSGQPIMARTLPSSVLSLLSKEGLPKGATAVVISRGDLGKKGVTSSKDLLSLLGKNAILRMATTTAVTTTTSATSTPAVTSAVLGKGINLSLKSLAASSTKDTKTIAPKTSIVHMGNKVLILEKPNTTSTKASKASGGSPAPAAGEKDSKGIGADLDSSSSAAEASSGEEDGKKSGVDKEKASTKAFAGKTKISKANSTSSQTASPHSTPQAAQQQQVVKADGVAVAREEGKPAVPVPKTMVASQSAGSQTPSQAGAMEKAASKSMAPSPAMQTPVVGLGIPAAPMPSTSSVTANSGTTTATTAVTAASITTTPSSVSTSVSTAVPSSTATGTTSTSAPTSVASSIPGTTGASSSSLAPTVTSQASGSAAPDLRSQQPSLQHPGSSTFPLPCQPFPDPMSQVPTPFPPSPMVGQNLPGFSSQGLGGSHYSDSSHSSQFGPFSHHTQNSFTSWPSIGQSPGFPQQFGSSLDLQSRSSFDHQPRAGSLVFDQQPSTAFDPQQAFSRQSSSSFDKPSGESAFQRHSQDSSLFSRQGPSAFEQPSSSPAFPRSSSLFDRHPGQGFDKQAGSMFPDLSLDMGLGGQPVSSAAAGLGLDSKAFGHPGMSRTQLFDPFPPSYSPYTMGHSSYPMGAQPSMGMGMQSSFPFMTPSLQSRGFGGLGDGGMFVDPAMAQSGSTVSPMNNCGGTYQSASPYNLASPFQQSYYSRPYPGYQPFPSSPYMPPHLPSLMGQAPHPSQTPSALNPPTSHPPL